MNNYDKVKSMTVKEMSQFLCEKANCSCCTRFGTDAPKCEKPDGEEFRGEYCRKNKQAWLELGNDFPTDVIAYIIYENPTIRYEKSNTTQTSDDCVVDEKGNKYFGKNKKWTCDIDKAEDIVKSLREEKVRNMKSSIQYHENELYKLNQDMMKLQPCETILQEDDTGEFLVVFNGKTLTKYRAKNINKISLVKRKQGAHVLTSAIDCYSYDDCNYELEIDIPDGSIIFVDYKHDKHLLKCVPN